MTNGSVGIADALLEKAGVRSIMAAVLDVSGPRAWKPAPAAYRYAVDKLGLRPEEVRPGVGRRNVGFHKEPLR